MTISNNWKEKMGFESAIPLAQHIASLGGRLYLVGGSVRDKLLGVPSHDDDYVITGLTLEQIAQLEFEKIVGNDFPVFLVDIAGKKCEVALARREKKAGVGYHGFTFYAGPEVTIEEDLSRRDLTINAMAEDVLTGELLDPYCGQMDLYEKRLRYTSLAFCDDPLRIYRVARFSAQLGFFADAMTFLLIKETKDSLFDLKPERILIEVKRAMLSKRPRLFFDVLKAIDALSIHFPEVAALDVPDKHDGTTYEHTMKLLEHGEDFKMRLALLTHDFGKPLTPREAWPAHHNHEKLGEVPVRAFCERLRISNNDRDFALLCAREHMRVKRLHEMRPGKIMRLVLAHKDDILDLLEMSYIDSACREGGDIAQEAIADFVRCETIKTAIRAIQEVTGDILLAEGKEPGPEFGEILFQRRVERFVELCKE